MRQQKYTQTQQVIDTLRTKEGMLRLVICIISQIQKRGQLRLLTNQSEELCSNLTEDFTDANFIVKNQNLKTYYQSEKRDFVLAHGDCFKLLKEFDFKFDMIFADPPYFLSNGGISLQSGKVVCVNKGNWDKGKSQEDMMAFNMEWLRLCRDKLKDNSFNMFRCKE